MDLKLKTIERNELIQIYNSLSPLLKQQLLTNARIINTTSMLISNEKKGRSKKNNQIKL
jgi:hypothetical protein